MLKNTKKISICIDQCNSTRSSTDTDIDTDMETDTDNDFSSMNIDCDARKSRVKKTS